MTNMKGVVCITQLCVSPHNTLFAHIPLATAAVFPGVSTSDDIKNPHLLCFITITLT